jgi:hypothetical protein
LSISSIAGPDERPSALAGVATSAAATYCGAALVGTMYDAFFVTNEDAHYYADDDRMIDDLMAWNPVLDGRELLSASVADQQGARAKLLLRLVALFSATMVAVHLAGSLRQARRLAGALTWPWSRERVALAVVVPEMGSGDDGDAVLDFENDASRTGSPRCGRDSGGSEEGKQSAQIDADTWRTIWMHRSFFMLLNACQVAALVAGASGLLDEAAWHGLWALVPLFCEHVRMLWLVPYTYDFADPLCTLEILFHRPIGYEAVNLIVSAITVSIGVRMQPELLTFRCRHSLMMLQHLFGAARLVSFNRIGGGVDLKVMPGVSMRAIVATKVMLTSVALSGLECDDIFAAAPGTGAEGAGAASAGVRALASADSNRLISAALLVLCALHLAMVWTQPLKEAPHASGDAKPMNARPLSSRSESMEVR